MAYDVIIIGGSFAGLSSAYYLGKKGLKVCLIEGGKIGSSTKSTGILTKSVIKDLKIPSNLFETEIRGIFLYSPKMVEYEYRFGKPLFYPSHTLELLKWQKNQALSVGTKIIENKYCRNIEINSDNVVCEGVANSFSSAKRQNRIFLRV